MILLKSPPLNRKCPHCTANSEIKKSVINVTQGGKKRQGKNDNLSFIYSGLLMKKKASIYVRADNHRIIWKPVTRAMMIVSISASTDRQPLMAQAHGIKIGTLGTFLTSLTYYFCFIIEKVQEIKNVSYFLCVLTLILAPLKF